MLEKTWLNMDPSLRANLIRARTLHVSTSLTNFFDANYETAVALERLGVFGFTELLDNCVNKMRAEVERIEAETKAPTEPKAA